MSKFNIILLGVAVVQIVLLLIIELMGPSRSEAVSETDLVGYDISEVGVIEISEPAEDATIRIERRGDDWVVASSEDFPARAQQIIDDESDVTGFKNGILSKLSRVKLKRPVIRQARNHKTVKVADGEHERRIVLRNDKGEALTEIFMASGPGRGAYVRRKGDNEVYQTNEVNTWDLGTDPTSWVNVNFVELKASDVVKLETRLADGTEVVLERRPAAKAGEEAESGEKEWWLVKPEEKRANAEKVDSLVGKLCRMSVVTIVGKTRPEAAFEGSATFTLELADGSRHTSEIGAETDDTEYPLKYSGSDFYIQVSKWAVKDLTDLKLEDLEEKKPETPDDTGAESKPSEDG